MKITRYATRTLGGIGWRELGDEVRTANDRRVGSSLAIIDTALHFARAYGMTPEQERWAEAIAIDKQHGDVAPAIMAERVRTLTLAGDQAGVARWREIEARYHQLRPGTIQ